MYRYYRKPLFGEVFFFYKYDMNYYFRGAKLNNEQYDLRLVKLNLKRIDDYIDSKTSIRHECVNCLKIFKVKPKELNRISCECILKGTEYKLKIKSKNLELLENYKNIRTKLLHKCLNCNNIFNTTPKTILQSKVGCPSCSGKKFTEEKYKSILPKSIRLKGEYVDTSKHTAHECLECGYEWITKPNYILHMGCGCPKCASSKGEKKIQEYLSELDLNFIKEKYIEINQSKCRFDFFLEELQTIIEFDGIQHFEARDFFGGETYLCKVKASDKMKSDWCIANKFKLIRISYQDIDKLTQEQLRYLIYN